MQKFLAIIVLLAVAANCAPAEPTRCPVVCPQLWSPTCATEDNFTFEQFDNKCILDFTNCSKKRNLAQVHSDFCQTELVEDLTKYFTNANFSNPKCKACDKSEVPVCMSNGKVRSTASNKCMVNYFSCVSGTNFQILKEEAC